jgi:hypothetical protein
MEQDDEFTGSCVGFFSAEVSFIAANTIILIRAL